MSRPRRAFYVDETMWTPNGYVPALVTEGEPGYGLMLGNGEFAAPWYWGTDIAVAKEVARKANADLGLSETDVADILTSSITAQIRADAEEQAKDERWEALRKGRPWKDPRTS